MTIDQLKERIEAQCMKHGFEIGRLDVVVIGNFIHCSFKIKGHEFFYLYAPNTDLLLERVDWECRVLKAYQSSATNGLDL